MMITSSGVKPTTPGYYLNHRTAGEKDFPPSAWCFTGPYETHADALAAWHRVQLNWQEAGPSGPVIQVLEGEAPIAVLTLEPTEMYTAGWDKGFTRGLEWLAREIGMLADKAGADRAHWLSAELAKILDRRPQS